MNSRLATRRNALADFLYGYHRPGGYTISEIVDASRVYDGLQGRYDKCRCDLLRLWDNGVVEKHPGRPSQWELV